MWGHSNRVLARDQEEGPHQTYRWCLERLASELWEVHLCSLLATMVFCYSSPNVLRQRCLSSIFNYFSFFTPFSILIVCVCICVCTIWAYYVSAIVLYSSLDQSILETTDPLEFLTCFVNYGKVGSILISGWSLETLDARTHIFTVFLRAVCYSSIVRAVEWWGKVGRKSGIKCWPTFPLKGFLEDLFAL